MARDLLLAIDEGTTGVTCAVMDQAGVRVGSAYREVPVQTPRPGWVEQDAEVLWQATLACAKDALAKARVDAGRLAGLGITNQRETTVAWDAATGKPLWNAIVWQDRRTAARCRELAHLASDVRRVTGLVVDPYFSATKMEWLLGQRKVGDARDAGRLRLGTIDTWLLWRLTDGERFATDATNASRTMLWDLRKGAWDEGLLSTFGVPVEALPEVQASASSFGETRALGGDVPVPVSALVGDQQAALFGQGCQRPGEAKCTYGTGAFLLQHTGGEAVSSRHGLVTTRAASAGPARFALEGSVFTAGAVVQWLRDGLKVIATASEADGLAETVPDAGGVWVVPAFTGLGAPHWDPEARGTVLGLTRGTTRAHVARAALDAIALQCHDVLEAMAADAGRPAGVLRVDGGAARSRPLVQAQADLLQAPVERPADIETTSRGAALLAGIVAGFWSEADAVRSAVFERFEPRGTAADAASRVAMWRKAVAACRAFGSGELARVEEPLQA